MTAVKKDPKTTVSDVITNMHKRRHSVRLIITAASQCRGAGFRFRLRPSCVSLHVLPVPAFIYSGSLPHSQNMHGRLIYHSKMSVGVAENATSCLSMSVGPAYCPMSAGIRARDICKDKRLR